METPELIACAAPRCTATFVHVPARRQPELCIDHAADVSRDELGWTPENSQ